MLSVLAFVGLSISALAAKDAVDYVDPFIGTGHMGKDFPGATVPFSMVKLSPDEGGNISYRYGGKFIQGFSFTHLGGADGGELGNVLVTPTTGPLNTFWGGGKPGERYGSNFSKSTEQATAGYYAVTLDEYQTRAEMTVGAAQRHPALHVSGERAVAHPDRPLPPQRRHVVPPDLQSGR